MMTPIVALREDVLLHTSNPAGCIGGYGSR